MMARAAAACAVPVLYALWVRPRLLTWGATAEEVVTIYPGDELVPDADGSVFTMATTLPAQPDKVWPWLVQMGFGRAGWYSYDQLNADSATDAVMPDFQDLKVGDIMPTHPGGGFLVKVVERERALVLYTDADLMRSQAERTAEESESFPEIKASWAFYLQPEDGGTRLIERFRARTPGSGPATAVLGEIMGTGIVLMTRKQMLSIKERVERLELAETEPTNTDSEPAWPAHDLQQTADSTANSAN
jgi:proline iminopeptidase